MTRARTEALSQGKRADQLPLSDVPSKYRGVRVKVRSLRHKLEAEVLSQRGAIGFGDAAVIQSCCRFELGAALAEHRLRTDETLTAEATESLADRIARFTHLRNREVMRLGLGNGASTDPMAGAERAFEEHCAAMDRAEAERQAKASSEFATANGDAGTARESSDDSDALGGTQDILPGTGDRGPADEQ